MPVPNVLSNIRLSGQKQIQRTTSDCKFVIKIEELNYEAENKKVQKYKDECVTLNRKHYVVVQTQMVRKNTKIPVLQNSPTIVLIKILECFVKMFITFKFVPMHCSRNEFKIVNRPISVNISLRKNIRENNNPAEFKMQWMHICSTSYALVGIRDF